MMLDQGRATGVRAPFLTGGASALAPFIITCYTNCYRRSSTSLRETEWFLKRGCKYCVNLETFTPTSTAMPQDIYLWHEYIFEGFFPASFVLVSSFFQLVF